MIDFREFTDKAEKAVKEHYLQYGAFARTLAEDGGKAAKTEINAYGCTAAVNILYMTGGLPKSYSGRLKYIKAIQSLQNPDTGLFAEEKNEPFHTTGMCAAALDMLDSHPLYPLTAMLELKNSDKLNEYMEHETIENKPLTASLHIGGLYAAFENSGEADDEFRKTFFKWLWNNTDEDTGLAGLGLVNYRDNLPAEYICGNANYMFSIEYRHMPLRYPARLIDTCIQFYNSLDDGNNFGKKFSFEEFYWIYGINRALRQTTYRRKDCMGMLRKFAHRYAEYLLSADFEKDGAEDLYMLSGTICALAELQAALPGMILTEKPLKLVVNSHPFI